MTQTKTDILILGGGIAGCIAAISLVDRFQVTLIDKLPEPKDRIGESLAPAAQRILRELNLCQDLDAKTEQKLFRKNLGMQSYWGSNQVHMVDHFKNPDGLGLNLDRKEFEVYLRKVAEERGVECLWNAQFVKSKFEENSWKVLIKSGAAEYQIRTQFVIDATGRQSHFARHQGIQRSHFDQLIACWISLPNTLKNEMSTISSTQSGWWYSAVVPNNKRVISFQTDSDLFEKSTFKTLDSLLILAKENEQIQSILNQSDENAILFHGVTAANSTKLNQTAGNKWVALGDAAISFDPLSSQGMFNAMACAMQLRNLIVEFGFTEQLQQHYSNQIVSIWHRYLQHKDLFYSQEQRWKSHEFWKRRHSNRKYP